MKPLFIPLRREWFERFRDGSKRVEWRAYGARWNREAIAVGRAVTLSCGYSGPRLTGVVIDVQQIPRSDAPASARTIFPDARYFCAIEIAVH